MAGDVSTLAVPPDEVKALGRLAYDVACQCRDGYASLDSDVQDMLGRWVGNNAKVFATGWGEFHEGAVQVWDALFELAASLGVTADTVRDTDQAFANGVNSLDLPETGDLR